ncbi:HEAT repeat domain-containing protein [Luteolibacter arcticus]|uniref:HEAT repeat domain-containing protein n=1 Tax=Luteolibacter arcticus TaxID=1581411 RepID=A0ABT3GHN7_9BACT|nr:HEAT repeat domain-containing protein [Luteolibacter arcticus]MCW1923000.1 HEAT repeat domain-containing protein [Luteolibacter arcticus]
MKNYLIIAGLALWTAFVAFTSSGPATPSPAAPEAPARKHPQPAVKPAPRETRARTAAAAPADTARLATACEEIEAAAITYEPGAVKVIRPWLLDADPQIRQAARDGLVMLGESDAIPFLRDAASRLEDPAEVASFHEAADLLSLPAWSESDEARQMMAEIVSESDR